MTTSCYLPVFYCFWLRLSTRSFLKFSLKNFRDCFIVQLSMFFVVAFLKCNFLSLTHLISFVNNFFNLFFKLFRTLYCFATAILDYHIFMFLSTVFLIYFDLFWLFTQLLYRSRDSLFILPLSYSNVNTYFKNILNCLKQ